MIVQSHVVLGELGIVLFEDLSLSMSLGKIVVEGMIDIFEVGDGVSLLVEVHGGTVEFDSCSVELGIQVDDGGIQALGLIHQSNVGLFELTTLGLESRVG